MTRRTLFTRCVAQRQTREPTAGPVRFGNLPMQAIKLRQKNRRYSPAQSGACAACPTGPTSQTELRNFQMPARPAAQRKSLLHLCRSQSRYRAKQKVALPPLTYVLAYIARPCRLPCRCHLREAAQQPRWSFSSVQAKRQTTDQQLAELQLQLYHLTRNQAWPLAH